MHKRVTQNYCRDRKKNFVNLIPKHTRSEYLDRRYKQVRISTQKTVVDDILECFSELAQLKNSLSFDRKNIFLCGLWWTSKLKNSTFSFCKKQHEKIFFPSKDNEFLNRANSLKHSVLWFFRLLELGRRTIRICSRRNHSI
jgi:hypothetical protein